MFKLIVIDLAAPLKVGSPA